MNISEKGSPGWLALIPYRALVRANLPLAIIAAVCCSARSDLPALMYASANNCIAIYLLALAVGLPFAFVREPKPPTSVRLADAKTRSWIIKLLTLSKEAL